MFKIGSEALELGFHLLGDPEERQQFYDRLAEKNPVLYSNIVQISQAVKERAGKDGLDELLKFQSLISFTLAGLWKANKERLPDIPVEKTIQAFDSRDFSDPTFQSAITIWQMRQSSILYAEMYKTLIFGLKPQPFTEIIASIFIKLVMDEIIRHRKWLDSELGDIETNQNEELK